MTDAPPEIVDALYGLVPDEFTAARNAQAASVDDRGAAASVKALKRPSVAAWAVNRLARDRAEAIAQAVAVGAQLREAQDDLDAATLAQLSRERRKIAAALARDAVGLGRDAGVAVSAAAREDIERTLNAAMMDAGAAAAVLSGRLVRALQAEGMGEVDLEGAVAGAPPEPAAEPEAPSDDLAARRARKAAEAAAREAEHTAASAERELAALDTARDAADDRARMLDERATALERDLARVREELATASAERERLRSERPAAVERAKSARKAATKAASALE